MTETHAFQAEVQEVLNLVIHSLYSNREIFLRELISNASDALDKRRVEGLVDSSIGTTEASRIRIDVDPEQRRLIISDNGIGMSKDELAENLGTIARSGTRGFLDELRERREAGGEGDGLPALIGQFGVGFYASFMVAEKICVESRRAGTQAGNAWISQGDGEFTIEEREDLPEGTRIELFLKEAEAGDNEGEVTDFADPHAIRGLIKKYSDFVEHRIEMPSSLFSSGESDDEAEGEEAPDGVRVVVCNSQRPLWARPKEEVTPEEHSEFYKHLAHDWNDPLETIHFRAEGTNQYTALLYLPKERPFDLFDQTREASRVSLYVKRVFIMANCEGLMPSWLRFVRGVVDSEDLPLNVSREILQENRVLRQIRKRLIRKTLDALGDLLQNRREDYVEFWKAFGLVIKEGIVVDADQKQAVAERCLFESTRPGGPWTLDEYVKRMDEGQEAIYFIAGEDRDQLASSPHLEALQRKGYEVLFFTDPVDEWVADRLQQFADKPLRSVDRGDAADETNEEKEEREKLDREHRGLLGEMELALDEWVKEVRFSSRLTDSPAVLVNAEDAMSPQMERMMRAANQAVPNSKRILELNPGHPLVGALTSLQKSDPASDQVRDITRVLHGQAVLAEGGELPDASQFAELITSLMLKVAEPQS